LTFSDYVRPSARLAAFMHRHVIYIYTHDSIGLGEDGPGRRRAGLNERARRESIERLTSAGGGTVIGARRSIAEQRASLLGERSGCDVQQNGAPRE
jgi:hypothetical protein